MEKVFLPTFSKKIDENDDTHMLHYYYINIYSDPEKTLKLFKQINHD